MSSTIYDYDASGLLARLGTTGEERLRFWRGTRVVNELRTRSGVSSRFTWLQTAGAPLAEIVSGSGPRKSLLASSVSGSVVLEADQTVRSVSYAPYGHRSSDASGGAVTEPAFNGEMLDAVSGCYLLGAGHHRPFSPTLGHFLAPDRAGPFGGGGLNTLSYCAADPVNRTDPTGHFWKWILAAAVIAVSAIAVVATGGTALAAIGGLATGVAVSKSSLVAIAGATLGVAGLAAESGSLVAHATGNESAGNMLGWVGLGLGAVTLAGAAAPTLARMAAKAAGKAGAKISQFVKRMHTIRTQGLSGRGAQRAAAQWAGEAGEAGTSGRSVFESLSDEAAMGYFKSASAMREASRKGIRMSQLTEKGQQSVSHRFVHDTGMDVENIPTDWKMVSGGFKSNETGEMVYKFDFLEPPSPLARPGLSVDEVASGMTAPHNIDTLPYARAGQVDRRVEELTREIRRPRASKPSPRHLTSLPY